MMGNEEVIEVGSGAAALREAMAPTVKVFYDLYHATVDLSARHGHLPSESSRAIQELAIEQRDYAYKCSWTAPVENAHTLGGFALFAAADHLHSFAKLFDGDKAPVFGHLVLARAALETSVVAAWLNEPEIPVDERIRRGLVERYHSAQQQRRVVSLRAKGKALQDEIKGWAKSLGWPVHTGKRPEDFNVAKTSRPTIGKGANTLLVGDLSSDLGQTIWSYLSAVIHGSWYALASAVLVPPDPQPGDLTPSLAAVGTDSRLVNVQTICLLRVFLIAGQRRVDLMGWETPEWVTASQNANELRQRLLRLIPPASQKV